MTDLADAPSSDHLTCWQCGAPAVAYCTYPVELVARARLELSALGNPVERGKIQDRLIIHVPRCRSCRGLHRLELGILIGALLAGAVFGQIVIPLVWPSLGSVPPLDLSIERRGSIAQGIGAAVGLVVAILGITLRRRARGTPGTHSYPAVMKARAIGWEFQVDCG